MRSKLQIKPYTPAEIAGITGGTLSGGRADAPVTSVCTDSREVAPGALFCAIPGERTDGHKYMKTAADAGAVCILAQHLPEEDLGDGCAVVVVPDTIEAICTLAAEYRRESRARVIAVTGSVGKTTTKEFIAAVSSAAFRTHKTEGNHNNNLGLSMTLFTLSPEDEVSVLEMGMSDLGEIQQMSRIAQPDIAVVTNIGTSHLASLGTRENICRAKLEIVAGMKADGILLLNGDEPLLTERAPSLVPAPQFVSVAGHLGKYRAVNIRSMEGGMLFDLIAQSSAVTNVRIPTLGRHNVYNALFAYAVGTELGMTDEDIRRGLLLFEGADMRQNIYPLGKITVIEDCYNASPESMRAALDVLAAVAARQGGHAAALLGDMLELGDYTRLMHHQLGQYAAQTKVQKLFCYGMMADVIAEAAIKHGIRAENVFVSLNTKDPQTMADMISTSLGEGDVLLVKASRAVAAERVIECLKKSNRNK